MTVCAGKGTGALYGHGGANASNRPEPLQSCYRTKENPMSAADELVDVIDDAGRTIGVVTRREMRRRRLPHRSTAILVFDHAGRLFVHLRTATKDVFPSHWDVAVGGVLGAGETF